MIVILLGRQFQNLHPPRARLAIPAPLVNGALAAGRTAKGLQHVRIELLEWRPRHPMWKSLIQRKTLPIRLDHCLALHSETVRGFIAAKTERSRQQPPVAATTASAMVTSMDTNLAKLGKGRQAKDYLTGDYSVTYNLDGCDA